MKTIVTKTTLGLLVLGSLGLTTTGALASWDHARDYQALRLSQTFSQQINTRQERQMDRIRAGMDTGHLTRAEFRELMHEQHKIKAMERHFRADGLLDAREFRRLDLALDRAGRNIRAEKHDGQARHAFNASPWQQN